MESSTSVPQVDNLSPTPLATHGLGYASSGWEVVPIPARSKAPPYPGTTGAAGQRLSYADVYDLAASHPTWNYGLRLPTLMVGLDVDNYDRKPGLATLHALEERLGVLKPTYVVSARDPDTGSGIRLYTCPYEPSRQGLGPGLDVIRRSHRYVMGPGSIHPSGNVYRLWWQEGPTRTWTPVDRVIEPHEVGLLTGDWDLELGQREDRPPGEGVDALPEGDVCAELLRLAGAQAEPGQARHDHYASLVFTIVGKAADGHTGATVVLADLERKFYAALDGDRRNLAYQDREFTRLVESAKTKAKVGDETCLGADCHRDVWITGTARPDASQEEPPDTGPDTLIRLHTAASGTVPWLIEGLLPRGELAILVGEEGIGKGLWGAWLTARANRLGLRVGLVSVEDDPTVVLAPRYQVIGAEATLIKKPVALPHDLDLLAAYIDQEQWDLLVIDPLVSVFYSDLKNTQTAKIGLDRLARLAQDSGCAVVAYVHSNRLDSDDLREKVGLSAGLRITARTVLHALADYDDPDYVLYVGIDKSNYGIRPPAIRFRKVTGTLPALGQQAIPYLEEEVMEEPLTIRDLHAEFQARKRAARDGRTSDVWPKVAALAESGFVTHAQIVALYDGNKNSANKAIYRWTRANMLERVERGEYRVTPFGLAKA